MMDWFFNLIILFLDENSVVFRLVLNTIAIILIIHLLILRVIELRRRDYIFPFRISLVICLMVILAFSIPIEWQLINLYLGIENINLQNLARVAGGLVILSFVLILEVIDQVIKIINARAKRVEEGQKKH